MADYAIIENGVVVNAVVAEPEYAVSQGWVELPTGAGIGWSYNGSNFINNHVATEEITAPTKEQLMAELAALTAKIQALE